MKSPSITLSPWQKKQAALLYHFASLDYLKNVKSRIDSLIGFSSKTLDKAAAEDRDAGLRSKRWGNRDTAQNWGNNAWAVLAAFQVKLGGDIAKRSAEIYKITGRNDCGRALAEYSMEWTTPEEQATFGEKFGDACERASNIDSTMYKLGLAGKWTDYSLTMKWAEYKHEFPRLPKLSVREDVFADSGMVPVRTGVYVCADDPNATLQFAWTGGGGKLLQCSTLNALGEAALAAVGRSRLWLDWPAMLDFVKAHANDRGLRSDGFFDDSQTPELAPSLVARQAFTAMPCRWHYVEMIHGDFEDIASDEVQAPGAAAAQLRFEAGVPCPVAGFYFTPAQERSGHGKCFWTFEARPVTS